MGTQKGKRGDRRDGVWLKDIDSLHAIMPYLYPNRADNEAFISERIDLENINKYIAEKNKDNPDEPYKVFHVLLAAVAKTIVLRPKMNRFIKGGRMYQRKFLSLAFVVKKRFSDNGEEALAFVTFDENDTMESVNKKVYGEINECRSEKLDNSTAEMDNLCKMPRIFLRFVMWILHKLDYYGKVPESLIKTDPNHASCMLSNLGSIGLKAGYHHLSNWGTNSLFIVIGQKKMSPFYDENGEVHMKETMDLGLTLDERLADGYYYSKTVKLLLHLLQNPELLELPAGEEVDYE
jgi:pyruvate/2-oxoglutarate dehydrogenase complex dihydrolipoamide acyltransferase (E2) component